MGGIVNAFATESKGEGETKGYSSLDLNAGESERRKLDGVGMLEGSLEWIVAERSRAAAIGEVRGRKWGW